MCIRDSRNLEKDVGAVHFDVDSVYTPSMLTLATLENDQLMSEIIKQKITAQIEGEPVVFLTGMRINKWWKLHLWLPVLAAAIGMQRSLDRKREHGLLGQDAWLGRNLIIVQYWRSYDALERWARDKRERHLPAWLAFVRRIGLSGDVGIWHETYRITPDNYPLHIVGSVRCV